MRFLIFLSLFPILAGCASTGKDDRTRADLHTQIGNGYFEHEKYPQALKEYLDAEKLDPDNPVIENNLGLTYFMRERNDLAEKHLRKSLELQPKYSDARNNLARIYIDMGRNKEAEAELKLVLKDLTYSGSDRAWLNMGLSRFNQNDWTGARKDFSESLKLAPENCLSNSYYGRTYFEAGEYERAAETLDHAIAFCQKQNFDEPHYYSALAWYRTGDKDRALARLDEVVKLYPDGKYRDKARGMLNLIRKGMDK